MALFAGPQKLGASLCEVLGLDASKVKDIAIHMSVGETPTITVTYLIFDEEATSIIETIKKYELHDPNEES